MQESDPESAAPEPHERPPRRLGLLEGQIWMAPDFDETPQELIDAFEGKTSKKAYLAIIEPTGNGFSAYVPDLPGCVAAADTREETEALIREAVGYHVEMLREHGDPVPEPRATASLVPA